MQSSTAVTTHDRYYVPAPSIWPIVGSVALLTLAAGFVLLLQKVSAGAYIMGLGGIILAVMLVGWFGNVIRENVAGLFNDQVDLSYRWGMGWFIFSEVMFFGALFSALFYSRFWTIPVLGHTPLLWPGFIPDWPNAGPAAKEAFQPMHAWGIPAINTLILLSSGATVTWAHWGLKRNNRMQVKIGLALTILLGVVFLFLQAHEYMSAGFTLKTGIYGATFYILTGFHGAHVTLGAIMLSVILGRVMAGH
ncbi:cytochrome c oxidase subunit III, partial [Novimethylophilus kurashikiensis]